MRAIKVNEIIQELGATLYGNEDAIFDSVIIDSRLSRENALFIGIKGENFDGSQMYEDAFSRGASVAIVENIDVREVPPGKAVLKVSSTHRAILDLAYYYRRSLPVKIIGITGSTGKTSTKDILHGMLKETFKVFKTAGNFNNELGLPLMIFSLDESYDYAILEMGMSAPLEIHNLARVAQPDYAIITNIGVSHIENLGSRENILKAKMEITDFFSKDSLLILNGDDNYLSTIKDKPYRILRGGLKTGDFVAKNLVTLENSIGFTVNQKKTRISIDIPGKHNISNAILCYIMARELGVKSEKLENVHVEKSAMRMEIVEGKAVKIINDCYNANPDSMKAALTYLKTFEGRKVALIGTMKELGDEAMASHISVAEFARDKAIDIGVFVGEYEKEMRETFGENSFSYKSVEEAMDHVDQWLKPEDTVLLKASRGMAFEQFLPKLKGFGGVNHD